MSTLSDILQVYTNDDQHIANIVLNGYNIEQGGPLGRLGAMRSFKLLEGDLWDEWYGQQTLQLRAPQGPSSAVRVAALPVEEDSFGLIEFV